MPTQRTTDEAGEVGLVGLAVAMLSAGMERIGTDLASGSALIAGGLGALFIGVRFRNVRLNVDADEVISAISDRAGDVAGALESRDTDEGNGGDAGSQ